MLLFAVTATITWRQSSEFALMLLMDERTVCFVFIFAFLLKSMPVSLFVFFNKGHLLLVKSDTASKCADLQSEATDYGTHVSVRDIGATKRTHTPTHTCLNHYWPQGLLPVDSHPPH